MPQVNELKTVNLDNYKIIDNGTSTFVYFTYPSTDCKFTGMISEKDGSYHNLMSFSYNSANPNVFISNNKNFTDLDQYTASSFVLTQKIHTSIRLTKGSKNDLVLIMEHIPSKNNRNNTAKLYVYYFLTPDPNAKSGGDFNNIFEKLDSTYKIMTQTNDFETMNLKNYSYPFNLDSGIIGQFGQNSTDSMTSLCFTFVDSNQNNHIIMQPPIPISSTIFTDVNNFLSQMNSKVMQHPIGSFFTNTDLTPNDNVTTNVLMKRYNDLVNDQKNNPLTPSQKLDAASDATRNTQAKAAEEVNKDKQGFTTLSTLREGVSFSCRPADSSTDLSATVVTDNDPKASTQAMESMTLAILYIGITVGMYLFAPGIYINTVLWDTRPKSPDGKQGIISMLVEMIITAYNPQDIKDRVMRVSLVSYIVGWIFIVLFIVLWSVGLAKPNLAASQRWFFVVFGFLLVVVCFLNTFSLQNYYTTGQMLKQMVLINKDLNRGTTDQLLEGAFISTPFYKPFFG
jgi:hypothetical protein